MRKIALRLLRSTWTRLWLLLLPGSGGLLAQALQEGAFRPPEDVIVLWAKRACLVLAFVSVLITLHVLLHRRHRLEETQSKWLLFIGLCVLPVPVTFLASGAGMEGSKEVEFCAACHRPMGPFVEDMKNPGSNLLAAVHYKNRYMQSQHCWTCHSDYGVAGTVRAKTRGLTHIFAVAAGTWKAPIKIERYEWRICLGCHGESALFKAPRGDKTAHEGVLKQVLEGKTACTECHDRAHPAPEKRGSQ